MNTLKEYLPISTNGLDPENETWYAPMPFLVALSSQLFCQLLKGIVYSLRDRRVRFQYLFISGGFVSAHTAFVSSLAMYLALDGGIGTPWFSVSAVLATVVIHDAIRLRGRVQEHTQLLNRLMDELPADRRELFVHQTEPIGHSGLEVILGLIVGVGYATLMWFLLTQTSSASIRTAAF